MRLDTIERVARAMRHTLCHSQRPASWLASQWPQPFLRRLRPLLPLWSLLPHLPDLPCGCNAAPLGLRIVARPAGPFAAAVLAQA